jgi:hypothetical protein
VSATAQAHLLYTRFRPVADQVRPLLTELARRPDAAGALRAECVGAYLAARRALVLPRVAAEIRGLDPARTELVELVSLTLEYADSD